MTTVSLLGLTKRYPNGFEAVTKLNLEVNSGELIALVGPSGCGKSTTLRMIAGLEDITEGSLLINGEKVNHFEPKDRKIGMVFQSYALYPHMTVRENIAFGLTLQKLPTDEIEQRVHDVAQKLQIESLLDRKPKEMSGGQRQRVAMARAIARQPNIFLFDEPLSNLDAQLRAEMRIEISRLQLQMKTTSFYVTHDQVEAMTLADRVVLLKAGKVQQIGPPLELHDRPANRFVATFIGSPTMNMLPGVYHKETISCLGLHITLPKEMSSTLSDKGLSEGTALEVGIRPYQINSYLSLDSLPEHLSSDDVIRTVIEAIEPLGSETICYCRLDANQDQNRVNTESSKPLVVRLSSEQRVVRNQTLLLHIELNDLHLFAADEQGARLL